MENWFVDFFSSFPDALASDLQVEQMELLHFDSLLKYNKTKKEKIKDIRKFTFLTFTIVINISAILFYTIDKE